MLKLGEEYRFIPNSVEFGVLEWSLRRAVNAHT